MSSLSAYQLLALSTSLAGSMAPQRLSSSIFPPPPQLGVSIQHAALDPCASTPAFRSGQGGAGHPGALDEGPRYSPRRSPPGWAPLPCPAARGAKPTARSAVLRWVR